MPINFWSSPFMVIIVLHIVIKENFAVISYQVVEKCVWVFSVTALGGRLHYSHMYTAHKIGKGSGDDCQ